MKMLISSLVLFCGSAAFAQVNVDQRVTVSQRDIIYQSANEPNVAYMMPVALTRLSDVKVISVGNRLAVQFDVGVPDTEFARVNKLFADGGKANLKASVLRAVEAEIEPKSATNIDDRFKPKVTVVGDVRNFTGPVRYVLSVRNIHDRHGKSLSAQMLKGLFGPKGIDNIAQIDVQFDAIVTGKPQLCKTAIGVFVGSQTGVAPLLDPTKLASFDALLASVRDADMVTPNLAVKILDDKVANCWDTPKPGVICFR